MIYRECIIIKHFSISDEVKAFQFIDTLIHLHVAIVTHC